MVRFPHPRPFIRPERQRPRLANVLVLAAFAPYALMFAAITLGLVFLFLAAALHVLGGV